MPADLPRGIIRYRDRYRVRITIDGQRHLVGDYDNLTDAKRALTLAKADVLRGMYTTAEQRRAEKEAERAREAAALAAVEAARARAITVSDWADEWLRLLAEEGRADGTIRSYRSNLDRHIIPAIGEKRLGEVTQEDVDRLLRSCKTASLTANTGRTLRSMYRTAVERRIGGLTEMPFRVRIQGVRSAPTLDSSKVATPAQVRALADAMPARLALSVMLAAVMSLRLGEVLGLQRGDFEGLDKEGAALLHVRRQWNSKSIGGATYTRPKAGSMGVLAIPEFLAEQVRDHLAAWVVDEPNAPLFTANDAATRPISQTLFDAEWRKARESVGMNGFRFHDLRHTGLTMYAQQGATVAEIMARGRHRHPDVAVRYQHATRERDRVNADALGRAFGTP